MTSLSTMPRRELAWYTAIMLLALALRVWDLGARSLWFDEATEYWVATAPLTQLLHYVSEGTGDPPLYSFLLHLWMKVGTHEVWLRMLSVIASLAGVAGVIVLARRLGGFATAIAAGVLAAVNAPDIRYAQDVGQYPLMIAAVAWSGVALHRVWTQADRAAVIAWAVAAFVATLSYYAAVFPVLVPAGCALIEALIRRDRVRIVRIAAALGLFLVITVPVLWPVLPDQMARVLDTRAVVADYPQARPHGLALVWRWLSNLFGFHFAAWPYTRVPAVVPVTGTLILLALALQARLRWTLWFVAAWAVYGIASLLEMFPFGFRWGLILLSPTVVLAAVGYTLGASEKWLRPLATLAYAALVVSSIVSLPNLTVRNALDPERKVQWPETEDLRPVVEYWHEKSNRLQPTYVFYGAAPAFAFYTQRYPDTRSELPPTWMLKCWHDKETPGFCESNNIYYGRWLRSIATPEAKLKSLAETLGTRPSEFWIVFSHVHGAESADILTRLKQNGYTMVDWVERRAAGAVLLRQE